MAAWFLGNLYSTYDQTISLDFEVNEASPTAPVSFSTGQITALVGTGISMVMLEIPLRGMVMFIPQPNNNVIVEFGDLSWTYTPGTGGGPLNVFVNQIGTPSFATSAPSTMTANPGQICLAYNVLASSSLNSAWDAWNAADGNLSTCWSSSAYMNQPMQGAAPYIQLDFQGSCILSRVILYPRWDAPNGGGTQKQPLCFPSQFYIEGVPAPINSPALYSSGPGFAVPQSLQVGVCIAIPEPTAAAYEGVQVYGQTLTTDGSPTLYFQLAEIGVYSSVIAAQATASSFFQGLSQWSASNLTDGQFQNSWSSDYWTTTSGSTWVTLDLSAPTPFDTVVLYPRWAPPAGAPNGTPSVRGFPITFTFLGSSDNVNWNELLSVSNFASPTQSTGIAFPLGNQFYRYIQLNITATGSDGSGTPIAQLLQMEVLLG
ncbi:discoidin domain-containing protein [Rudaea cellulosilytica]|uniref:discoidin domain-containing protein n=1 Tax=Rudaea cellulosilytica TaxID=540746 RepID=UPI00039C815F|nr:discoidin domain-containing protein [Rudaea cellulosilytica]